VDEPGFFHGGAPLGEIWGGYDGKRICEKAL
jgi:hypothetical protein